MSTHRDFGCQLRRVESWTESGPDLIVPSLVGEVGCVRGQALVWSSRLEQEEIFKKKK